MIAAPMPVPDITTERLRLVSLSPTVISALLRGARDEAEAEAGFEIPLEFPTEPDRDVLDMRLTQMTEDPAAQEWLMRAMLKAGSDEMIGHIGFHGPPDEGFAELGYTVFPDHRRKGYAIEGARALMAWAGQTHGVRRFRLSISPSNEPSLAMAAKMGFDRVGEQMDEIDGLEYIFELTV